MKVVAIERSGQRLLECVELLPRASEALELVSLCHEHDSNRVLIESHTLPAEFFDLRTGLAGEILQKLVNYHVRLAGVFPSESDYNPRFRELLLEAKRGKSFRSFAAREDAEAWLAGGG
jgi:hypothetical protein